MWVVDRPMAYGVYYLFHDWWAEAPQGAIDSYMEPWHSIPGAQTFLQERAQRGVDGLHSGLVGSV